MDNFLLVFEDYLALAPIVCKYDKIHIFFDDFADDKIKQYVMKIFDGKQIVRSCFPHAIASVSLSDRVQFADEELVVAVGGIQLQSLAKYYAMSVGVDYAMIPLFEVAEFSFSKYAFVKEQYFCFFECQKPQFIFVCKKFFPERNIKILKQILTYKNIVKFEKEFENDILQEPKIDIDKIVKCVNLCDDEFFSIIKIYGICASELSKHKTYQFLGNEYCLLSLFAGTNMLDDILMVDSLIFKLYECVMKFPAIDKEPDLNRHIKLLKDKYSISPLDLRHATNNLFSLDDKKNVKGRLHAYLPYLKEQFAGLSIKFVPGKIDGYTKQLESALALCGGLTSRKNFIRYLRDFGYFEKLLL